MNCQKSKKFGMMYEYVVRTKIACCMLTSFFLYVYCFFISFGCADKSSLFFSCVTYIRLKESPHRE